MSTRVGAALASAIVLTAVGALVYSQTGGDPPPKFCTLGLAISAVSGRSVILQDQGASGRDGCDLPPTGKPDVLGATDVLGFDCKVRTPSGEIVATTTPNRSDGTCGQPDR